MWESCKESVKECEEFKCVCIQEDSRDWILLVTRDC